MQRLLWMSDNLKYVKIIILKSTSQITWKMFLNSIMFYYYSELTFFKSRMDNRWGWLLDRRLFFCLEKSCRYLSFNLILRHLILLSLTLYYFSSNYKINLNYLFCIRWVCRFSRRHKLIWRFKDGEKRRRIRFWAGAVRYRNYLMVAEK